MVSFYTSYAFLPSRNLVNIFRSNSPLFADIVDTAVNDDSFKTLVTALTAATLIETLKGPGILSNNF